MAWKVFQSFYLPEIPVHDEILDEVGAEFTKAQCTSEDELLSAARDADAIVTVSHVIPITRKVAASLPKCRIMASVGIGYDNIDVKACTEHGICVTNTPTYCLAEVSDHTMALLLACARKLTRVNQAAKDGTWNSKGTYFLCKEVLAPMSRLEGQTLGFIGFGNIPRAVAPKAKSFGLRMIAYSPHVPGDVMKGFGVEPAGLDQVLEQSDYVSVHAALTPENRHMIGIKQLKMMKNTAYIINTARGDLIDERALIAALEERQIAGAALDVIESEPTVPMPDYRLFQFDNVIITAHTAYYSQQSDEQMFQDPLKEVARVLKGEWPQALINPDVKEKFEDKWGPMR